MRSLIKKGTLPVPGAFNAATALLIEEAGFGAVYVSGAGLSNSCGLSDTGLLSRDEVVRSASYIIRAVGIPAIVDVDTGFGGPEESARTVTLFEAAGAEAVQIEDQEFPKRCGHLRGKSVIPAGEFVEKIKAASGARRDPDFLIIARTDARAVEGMDRAIERANRYAGAGADIIFPEALETKEEFREFAKGVNAPLLANMTEFGKGPYLSVEEFAELGYSMVIFPMTAFRAAMKAMEGALAELKREGTQKGMLDRLETREELYRLIKYSV
ncbi:MAG: methylisocitrate lyase [Deltaproteobacteria bacterium]|nr:methylisocitrate lyase [Deltaproteobacteria bacterium]